MGGCRRPSAPVAPAAGDAATTAAVLDAPEPEPACDPHVALQATLRERAQGAAYVGRAIRILEVMNTPGAIHIVGWAAESSEEGPPCFATFTYELHGVRRTARFKFWPRAPARLATTSGEAEDMADLVDLSGASGPAPTQEQLRAATMLRLANGNYAEDAYVDPADPEVLVVRRQHCVAGNVDYSPRAVQPLLRMLRQAHIRRIRCNADAPWTFDIPRRGRAAPPYLPLDGGT